MTHSPPEPGRREAGPGRAELAAAYVLERASRQSGNRQQPAGMQRSSPQLPRLGATSTNQLRPGGPAVGKRDQTPPNPFGLSPLNTNPNTGLGNDRKGEEKEEEDNEE